MRFGYFRFRLFRLRLASTDGQIPVTEADGNGTIPAFFYPNISAAHPGPDVLTGDLIDLGLELDRVIVGHSACSRVAQNGCQIVMPG